MCPLGTGSAATEGPHSGGRVASAPTRGLCSRPDLLVFFCALVAVCRFCVYSLVSLLLTCFQSPAVTNSAAMGVLCTDHLLV